MKEVGSIVSLFLFLAIAVWEDYHSQKISNLLILTAFVFAVLYRFHQNGIQGILFSILHAGKVMLFLFPLYRIKAFGAGDIKLLGVAAAYLSCKIAVKALLVALYLSLIFIFISFLCKRNYPVKKIEMSGPIAGGILFVLCKEGCI